MFLQNISSKKFHFSESRNPQPKCMGYFLALSDLAFLHSFLLFYFIFCILKSGLIKRCPTHKLTPPHPLPRHTPFKSIEINKSGGVGGGGLRFLKKIRGAQGPFAYALHCYYRFKSRPLSVIDPGPQIDLCGHWPLIK